MSTTIIHIPVEQVLDRLGHGNLWTRGWGTPDDSTQPTCLHGAIRFCAPVPGDAQLIEQVGARFGFGTFANDQAADFAAVESLIRAHADISDDMLADTFGPQWQPIVVLVRRAAILTSAETKALDAARAAALDAAWAAARDAALDAAWDAARAAALAAALDAAWAAALDAAWDAARAAAWDAARAAARDAAREAARALVVRDQVGDTFTQAHYDTLTRPWATVIGPVHPDDAPVTP
mgnify:CR=1 FL=1